ncbi:MAG: MBL fold metallo-hydrolase [Clostridiales bacterium]|jgi:phosphoribosyl 1,2-cyclic phosphodiesterase|nr:MBL fold metallo-hydrolase [Clostridiales bacterium]
MLKFRPIASGSNGNCLFLSDGETKILIDAGLSGRAVESGMNEIGETCAGLSAILVTHEHSDHIRGAGIVARRYGVPVYATEGTWVYADRHRSLGKLPDAARQYIYPGGTVRIGAIAVSPFAVPHDAAEPVAFAFKSGGGKVCVATDIGHINDDILAALSGADALLAEGNHDGDMLWNGRYSYPLKKRIWGEKGHLSNVGCGELIRAVYSERLRSVYIGHMSAENNTPELAYSTVEGILRAGGVPVGEGLTLRLANRGRVSAETLVGV